MSTDKFNYIIFHNYCLDGFTGFYIFMKSDKWEKKPIVHPDYPSSKDVPPDIDGKNVIIIDVAYNAGIIKEIAERCNKLLFIDHHVSIKDDVSKLKLDKPHKVIYDVNECGATLTWKYVYGNKKIPKFVQHIRDNDIGLWEMKDTHHLVSYMDVHAKFDPTLDNLKNWDNLFNNSFLTNIIEKGKSYYEYKINLVKMNYKKHSIKLFPGFKFKEHFNDKYTVAVLNNKCPSPSMLGKYVVENVKCDFCIMWEYNMKRDVYIITMRSKKTDVSKIAKVFNGGGHKYAASFSLNAKKYKLSDLFVSDSTKARLLY